MVRKEDIIASHCCSSSLERFLEIQEANKEMFFMNASTVELYKIETKDLLVVCAAVMGVASQRIVRETSTNMAKIVNKNLEEIGKGMTSLPLVGRDLDNKDLAMYPDPLRSRALPCSNPDGDTATSFVVANGSMLYDEIKEGWHPSLTGVKLTLKGGYEWMKCIYEVPEWDNIKNCKFVAEVLGQAFFMRCTGCIQALEGIPDYRKDLRSHIEKKVGKRYPVSSVQSKLSLPVSGAVFDTIGFLLANSKRGKHMCHYQTGQHKAGIPSGFTQKQLGVDNMCNFLAQFFLDNKGMMFVANYLNKSGMRGGICRTDLIKVLAKSISDCSTVVEDNDHLRFILHHVVKDVESMIPEFAGEVTLESVHPGYGSEFGIRVLTRTAKGMPNLLKRMKSVHDELLILMTELAKPEVEDGNTKLLAMGYKYDKQLKHIVSIFNGRKFSYTDTEHIACKLYLCIAYAHPSRTISDEPYTHSDHCWPVPSKNDSDPGKHEETRSWLTRVEGLFQQIRQATTQLGNSGYFEQYSHYLEYHDDGYVQGSLGEGFRQVIPEESDNDEEDQDAENKRETKRGGGKNNDAIMPDLNDGVFGQANNAEGDRDQEDNTGTNDGSEEDDAIMGDSGEEQQSS